MDFLKTLLAYMALTMALSVQEGPLPQEVPTPTPMPPHVTATLAPLQTAVPTATPSPTPPPQPTLTPNLRYNVLKWGDNGREVRRVQERLIELGYLAEGAADGAYGTQTTNAVRRFQRANHLSADGQAGPATQTALFEDPNVIPYQTSTPAPTATPTLPPATPTLTPVPTVTAPLVIDLPQPAAQDESSRQAAEALGLRAVEGGLVLEGNRILTNSIQENGTEAAHRIGLWLDAEGHPVVSLHELAASDPDWTLLGDTQTGYTLIAAGYMVTFQLNGEGMDVSVDGSPLTLAAGDVRLHETELYVTDTFLIAALNADVIYDTDESTLLLNIAPKSVRLSAD